MSVAKRGEWYHFRFKVGGVLSTGVCRNPDGSKTRTKEPAEAYERQQRRLAEGLAAQKTQAAIVENYRDVMAGGKRLALADAWKAYLAKPRRRQMRERHQAMVKGRWENFLAFLRDQYPEIQHLQEVRPEHAAAYIGHIRTRGQWIPADVREFASKLDWSIGAVLRAIANGGKYPETGSTEEKLAYLSEQRQKRAKKWGKNRVATYTDEGVQLSTAAQNNYLATCAAVFAAVGEEAGVYDPPFKAITKVENAPEEREAFTPEDLKLIGGKATGWLYHLFMVATNTGLREGDVCTLRWSEVDLAGGWIRRRMLKTGKRVEIPILPALARHLRTLPKDGEHVFPELADRYENHRTSIGCAVSRFLADLKIETTREVPGRTRAVSVKDVHSCRHTFCYLAALNGVPFPIVQGVVGHMDSAMTRRYMDHATADAKRDALKAIPDYLSNGNGTAVPALPPAPNTPRAELHRLVDRLSDEMVEAAREALARLVE
ncbi:MAG: hypothetical protein A3K19_11825 [Lentisphaerae bacterium RIFOXYB12_FULL_65_16]|nr:MAG: hypothetical protein A3K18_23295 [Lentisphaerae bacterium RIFOXYA12_64_32]OGV88000.1 MAG: hypothetical protein A3K19_11825 [Lentisphaerae bacterium RIFOXYB12_FULL_65_16]